MAMLVSLLEGTSHDCLFGEGTQKPVRKTHQNREQRTCLFCVLSSVCFNVIFLFDIDGINW